MATASRFLLVLRLHLELATAPDLRRHPEWETPRAAPVSRIVGDLARRICFLLFPETVMADCLVVVDLCLPMGTGFPQAWLVVDFFAARSLPSAGLIGPANSGFGSRSICSVIGPVDSVAAAADLDLFRRSCSETVIVAAGPGSDPGRRRFAVDPSFVVAAVAVEASVFVSDAVSIAQSSF